MSPSSPSPIAATQPDALSLRRYDSSHGSHTHEHFQVLLGLGGVLELEVDGRGKRVAMGEGCVIAPGSRHDFESRAGSRCLVLDSADPGWAACHSQPARRGQAMALARQLAPMLQQADGQLLPGASGLLLKAWQSPPVSGSSATPRIRRAIDWLGLSQWAGLRLHENLALADLAQQVALSQTHFAARCREETGLSAMDWLRDLRLTRARHLRAAGFSVAQVAWRCGYQSPSALTAALRRDGPGWQHTV